MFGTPCLRGAFEGGLGSQRSRVAGNRKMGKAEFERWVRMHRRGKWRQRQYISIVICQRPIEFETARRKNSGELLIPGSIRNYLKRTSGVDGNRNLR